MEVVVSLKTDGVNKEKYAVTQWTLISSCRYCKPLCVGAKLVAADSSVECLIRR